MSMIRTTAIALFLTALGFAASRAQDASQTPTNTSFVLWQLPNQTTTQMMSYVIQTIHGKVIVIDGGNAGDAPYLLDFLRARGNSVEAWIVSHAHSDHVGAFCAILRKPGELKIAAIYGSMPDRLWTQQYETEGSQKEFELFETTLTDAGRTVAELVLGQVLEIDGIRIEVLGVKNPEITKNALNNSSLVIRMSDHAKSVLFPGDLGVEGGDKLLNSRYADHLRSDFVQMAHHGQNGVSQAFYRRVNPTGCLWPTPKWLWENDKGQGKGSGTWRTLEVRAWMDEFPIQAHYLMWEGLKRIE
jgi:beta-lactamase superfamily II metal-dependent hydrolase